MNGLIARNERSFESIVTGTPPYGAPIPLDGVKNVEARPAWGPDLCTLQELGHFRFNRALVRINNPRTGVADLLIRVVKIAHRTNVLAVSPFA